MGTEQLSKDKHVKQTQRFRRAVVIVGLFVVVLIAACVIPKFGLNAAEEQTELSDDSYVAALKGDAISGADMQESLADAGFLLADNASSPEWFEQEILSCDELDGVIATSDWSTVGFYMQGSVSDVFKELSEEFINKGWLGYSSGVDGSATYMKEEGVCTWMMVSCTEIEDTVSVVLRIQHT